jgi:hypothetical protein
MTPRAIEPKPVTKLVGHQLAIAGQGLADPQLESAGEPRPIADASMMPFQASGAAGQTSVIPCPDAIDRLSALL